MAKPKIIFEDEAIVVFDKQAGLLVHPAPGHEGEQTLSDLFVAHCPQASAIGSKERPGVVHRLDCETSGVIVFAKTAVTYRDLRHQFEDHRSVKKAYLAVCHGRPKSPRGTIDTPVGRDRLAAVSHYETLATKNGISLIAFRIDTGRMHQIRIHAAALGCPVIGDRLYGDKTRDAHLRPWPTRQLLHAVELSFLHPVTHQRVNFVAPPPPDLVYVHG